MLLAALTGGIGSGKSTVADGLAKRGAVVIDADAIGREILEPGGLAYQPVVDHFGPGVVRTDGTINRPALAAAVFNDPAELAELNRLTHPVIAAVMTERVAEHDDEPGRIVILDLALMSIAEKARFQLSAVIVVDTPEEVAVQRLVTQRGFSDEDAAARVGAQITREERRRLADLVLDNSGDRCALEAEIDRAWTWLQEQAAQL
jgi:dephospho-CoA kinase